jgi:hypothetical protein
MVGLELNRDDMADRPFAAIDRTIVLLVLVSVQFGFLLAILWKRESG